MEGEIALSITAPCIKTRNLSALLLHQRFINFRPQKQDADTQVQPQHHQNHGGQAPVHVREIAEMIKINREQLRRSDPAYRGEHRSRKLAPGRQFLMGQVGVEPRENSTSTDSENSALKLIM